MVHLGVGKKKIHSKQYYPAAQSPAFHITLRNCSGETWFSAQSEQRTLNKSETQFFKVWGKKKKKNTSTYIVNHYGHGTWEGNLIEGEPALHPGKGAFNLNC